MLINLSNHPYSLWSDKQKKAASLYGECIDLPFPQIDAMADELNIKEIVDQYFTKIQTQAAGSPVTVHLMGEMTFSFSLIKRLQQSGIPCIAATSARQVKDFGSGRKEIVFKFKRFRKYF